MSALTHEKDSGASWLKDARPEHPSLPIEKMPQLNNSLERFSESVGEALGGVFGPGVAGVTERITTTTTFELLGAYQGYPAAVLRSQALDSRALLIFDPKIVDILLNGMFAVDPGVDGPPADAPPRDRTAMESQLVAGLARILVASLQEAFAPVASFDLGYESLNTIIDVNILGAREMPAIMAQYTVKTRGGTFRLVLVFPQTLTTPLTEMFSRGPDPEAAKFDPQWTRKLERGVTQARLALTAILDESQISLGEVANWRIGSTFELSSGNDGRIRIECVERGVFICKLGEARDRYALEIEDIVAHNSDDDTYARN